MNNGMLRSQIGREILSSGGSVYEVMSGLQNNIYVRQGIAKIWNYARKGLEIPEKTVSYWY